MEFDSMQTPYDAAHFNLNLEWKKYFICFLSNILGSYKYQMF